AEGNDGVHVGDVEGVAVVFRLFTGGDRRVDVAGELVGEVDERRTRVGGDPALLRDAGGVIENGARIIGGGGECAGHRAGLRALLGDEETGAERRRGQQARQGNGE